MKTLPGSSRHDAEGKLLCIMLKSSLWHGRWGKSHLPHQKPFFKVTRRDSCPPCCIENLFSTVCPSSTQAWKTRPIQLCVLCLGSHLVPLHFKHEKCSWNGCVFHACTLSFPPPSSSTQAWKTWPIWPHFLCLGSHLVPLLFWAQDGVSLYTISSFFLYMENCLFNI